MAKPASRADATTLRELCTIPGVGPSIARNLLDLGITSVAQLRGQDPDDLYARSNRQVGAVQDRCLLYTFRCAVYYASPGPHDPEKLKWWSWSDARLARAGEPAS